MSPCYTPNCSNTRKSNKYELNTTQITLEINNTAAHATYVPHSCFASVPALAQSSFKGWTMDEQHLVESREPPLSFTIQGKEKTIGPKAFSVKNNKFWILNCCLYTNKTKSSYNSCCFTPAEHVRLIQCCCCVGLLFFISRNVFFKYILDGPSSFERTLKKINTAVPFVNRVGISLTMGQQHTWVLHWLHTICLILHKHLQSYVMQWQN